MAPAISDMAVGVGQGWSRGSEERQEAGSSNTARTEPDRVAHSSTEKGQGEPGKGGETSTAAGVWWQAPNLFY